jgi:hypothetical protein
MKLATKLFFLSGGLVTNRMGTTKADDLKANPNL